MAGKVLVVDDDQDICSYLRDSLSGAGFEVETRLDGPAALAAFREAPYDVVVTDIRMPEMDGLEVLRSLKAIDPDVGVIIVSATNGDRTKLAIDAMRGGASDYFFKPLQDVSEFERAVGVAVRRRAARREQTKTLRELEQRVRTDPLTGLANRRELEQRLREEFSRVGRGAEEFSLALFDIDSFKVINDRHGHVAGDTVLRAVADALREGCRAYDVKARYGGDEFIVVMPYTQLQQGVAVAEKIRRAVASLVLRDEGAPLTATLSAGVTSTVGREGLTPESLIHRADMALYEAKKAGRNQTVPLKRGEPVAEVLIVGSGAESAQELLRLCESLDVRAEMAGAGAEALLLVRNRRYALALVDSSLGAADVNRTIGMIKDEAPMTLTALLADEEASEALPIAAAGAGPALVIRKPMSRDQLRNLLTGARRRT